MFEFLIAALLIVLTLCVGLIVLCLSIYLICVIAIAALDFLLSFFSMDP